MAIANALNKDLQYSNSLSLTNGLSGNIPMTCFNSGTNASASTYLCYDTSNPGGGNLSWKSFPSVQSASQGSLAYYPTTDQFTIAGHTPSSPRSVYTYNQVGLGDGLIGNIQLNDGQFPFVSSTSGPIAAGSFLVGARGGYVQNGANSILLDYIPVVQVITSSQTITFNASVNLCTVFIIDSSSLVTLTLSTSTIKQIFYVFGRGSGGWKLQAPAGGTFRNLGSVSTSGGSISSSSASDSAMFVKNFSDQYATVGVPQSSGLVLA